MRTKNIILVISTALIFTHCLTSCSPVLYTTIGQNVPMLQKKGEIAVSGGAGYTNHAAGINAQFAAAVTDKIVVMSSYYSLQADAASGGGNYFELGAGKYSYKPDTRFCSEFLFGMGFGSINNTGENQTFVNVNYIKPFIQPSFGFTSEFADIAFTPRIALVSFTSHSDFVTDAQLRTNLDGFYSSKSALAFEPGITIRLGYKYVKLQGQYNYTTFSYNGNNFNPVDKDFFSVGLYFVVTDRWLSLKQNSK